MKTLFASLRRLATPLVAAALCGSALAQKNTASSPDHLVFEGGDGPGKGKHVVLLAGDEEYRSEEAMPLMAQILNKHGFKCTVLFSLNAEGIVDPPAGGHLSNPAALDSADAIMMSLRFRHWDDKAMTHFDNALKRGVPIIALRTSTHAFKFPKESKWFRYSFNASKESGWEKGFGRQVIGETWISHHGKHKKEGTRSVVVKENAKHPVLSGVGEIFGPTDVYGATPLKPSTILLLGAVTETLEPDSANVKGKKNDPMQPIAWVRQFEKNRVMTTTMGSSNDLLDEDLRRLVANAVFWGLGMDVPAKADVALPGPFNPTNYSFGGFLKGKKPADFIIKSGAPAKAAKSGPAPEKLEIKEGDRIALIGAGMGSRMIHFGHFETELFQRFPKANITIRNLCDEGNTPGFRPHPGRDQDGQYAFDGAKELLPTMLQNASKPQGHFEKPDEWLSRLKADTIIAFFGFNSSFGGPADVERYQKELTAFIKHTLAQNYNGDDAPQLALVSPTAMQDYSAKHGLPKRAIENANLSLYTEAMRSVCAEHGVLFVDTFTPSKSWYGDGAEYTTDGALLNDKGYKRLAPLLADKVFGTGSTDPSKRDAVHAAVTEKNWCWLNDYKIPNGVHVYGRRYNPYGPGNYPFELKKTREMTAIRDRAIHATLAGKSFDLAAEDAKTSELPPVKTNYKPSNKNGTVDYMPGKASQTKLEVADGYKMELFASEDQFPDLQNPVQMAFDNKGRLWVATMSSYPHYRIGDAKPKDKLLIFEDTDNDGKADKQITWTDQLHIPIGFEISHDGVYISQSGSLVRMQDTDGDDKADTHEVLLSGFDDHDTHHAISAFCADGSGAFVMAEGVFLHSNIETADGPQRGTNGGFYRYSPQRKELTRHAQFSIPNPWGIAYDAYGQDFFLHTSGTSFSWMTPGTVKSRYGHNMRAPDLLKDNKVRPTSGVEFVHSRHFPDEVQGDMILCNAIGYLGAKQHQVIEDGTGFTTKYRQDLFVSKDLNFRPTDLEFAPDGSLYVVDWHNALIGHMQHSARDPLRDHNHGRIYRVTYPSRPLVKPPKVDGADIAALLENLKLPEQRARYRTRRELRERDAAEVTAAASAWAAKQSDERLKLEALWVTWGADQVDVALLGSLLKAKDHRVRAGAVRVLRHNTHKVNNQAELLMAAANDDHGRVRMEAITAASWLPQNVGMPIVAAAKAKGVDDYSKSTFDFAEGTLSGSNVIVAERKKVRAPRHLKGRNARAYVKGAEIYAREAHCITCHQPDGKGLPAAQFPPLDGTEWVNGDPDRLIKLTLKGLMGPIEVKGKKYPGQVPMTPFESLLNDDEIASVLTYVRNSFGNKSTPINANQVKQVRDSVKGKAGLYSPAELLKEHPLKK